VTGSATQSGLPPSPTQLETPTQARQAQLPASQVVSQLHAVAQSTLAQFGPFEQVISQRPASHKTSSHQPAPVQTIVELAPLASIAQQEVSQSTLHSFAVQ
jgi:hypothetical protein